MYNYKCSTLFIKKNNFIKLLFTCSFLIFIYLNYIFRLTIKEQQKNGHPLKKFIVFSHHFPKKPTSDSLPPILSVQRIEDHLKNTDASNSLKDSGNIPNTTEITSYDVGNFIGKSIDEDHKTTTTFKSLESV